MLEVLKQVVTVSAGVNDDLDGSLENRAVLFHVTNIPRDRGITKDPATIEKEKCARAITTFVIGCSHTDLITAVTIHMPQAIMHASRVP